MRAITGAVLSSKPCSFAKAARILSLFATSDLPSSDAATYLRTAADATNDHHLFRRELRRYQQQGGDIDGTYEGEETQGSKSEKKHEKHQRAIDQDGEGNADEEKNVTVLASGGSQGIAGEKKSKKKKGAKEDQEPRDANQGEREREDSAALHRGLHSPVSDKRKKKKKKDAHVKEEDEAENVKYKEDRKALDGGLQPFQSEEEIDKEKKGGSNKKKKKHLNQEEEASGAKELEQKIVRAGAAEQGIAGEEMKRKKTKHAEEGEEKKEKTVTAGDLGSDKKRKKKRGRGDDDNDNDKELVEHTKKKQRKQSWN